MRKLLIFSLLVLILIICPVLSLEYGRLPIKSINVSSDNDVLVKYDFAQMLHPDILEEDIGYIMGGAAKDYPSQNNVIIDLVVGDETVYSYSAKISDIKKFANGEIKELEFDQGETKKGFNFNIDSNLKNKLFQLLIPIGVFIGAYFFMVRKNKKGN